MKTKLEQALENALRKLAKSEDNVNVDELMSENTCCICNEKFEGFGNNAEPIKKGICCGLCNDLYVIPARIKQLKTK